MAARNVPSKGAKADKIWRDAIMRAVKRVQDGEKTQHLEMLADKLVATALEGDVAALKEIGDRLDGKPTQAVDVSGKLDLGLAERLEEARRRIAGQ